MKHNFGGRQKDSNRILEEDNKRMNKFIDFAKFVRNNS